MERIQALISKLQEQANQKADSAQMMLTVQLIQNELAGQQKAGKVLGTSKVAVVLPSRVHVDSDRYESYAPRPVEEIKEKEETQTLPVNKPSTVQQNGKLDLGFDPLTEIPTLSHQLDDKKRSEPESLNDKLRQSRTEVFEALKETPVKDLRKAIGINDRFVFINDLFRGDEAMYERSIKTINSFAIFPEAEYWISRELKVKLGWDADSPAVLQFDHLVKRRFS